MTRALLAAIAALFVSACGPADTGGPEPVAPVEDAGPTPVEEEPQPGDFDRVIVRGPAGASPSEVADILEAELGERIVTARGLLSFTALGFAPLDPPRDEAAQDALVARIRSVEGFADASPDRRNTPR